MLRHGEDPNGHVYFLEAKHLISASKLEKIYTKFEKSLAFLNISPSMVTAYVAGKYWAKGQNLAVKLGFGLMQENGIDLKVEDPRPKPEVERGAESIAADPRGDKGMGGEHGVMVGKPKGKKKKGKE